MRLEYLRLKEILEQSCRGRKVYFLANPGNWGDGLIRAGTLKFFQDIGLEFEEIPKSTPFNRLASRLGRKSVLIFGGGGGWCKNYNSVHKRLTKHNRHRSFKKIIILPSTYEFTYGIPNAIFFRRDSYQSKVNMPSSIFCHDMAFYLGGLEAGSGAGVGYFFRTDIESSNKITLPKSNMDLSEKGKHFTPVYEFFKEIANYKVVHTDRLHVGIASALLGRETHIYAGNYFKTEAVFLSSIKDFFDNVTFHDASEFVGK
jgi:exopolysaccharide biosynthesis predicted pyruvyltransferase EpsI